VPKELRIHPFLERFFERKAVFERGKRGEVLTEVREWSRG
jgi:hypothetical protein